MRIETIKPLGCIVVRSIMYAISLAVYYFINLYILKYNVAPIYSYMGFVLKSAEDNSVVISLIWILLLSIFLSMHNNRVKLFYLNTIIIVILIPMLCVYSIIVNYNNEYIYMFMCIICFIITSFVALLVLDRPYISTSKKSYCKLYIPIMICLIFIVILRYVVVNGLGIFNLNMLLVYKYRAILAHSMNGLFAYYDSLVIKIIVPLSIIYCLYYKKYYLLILFCCLQVVLYGLSSQKTVLFALFVILPLFYYMPIFTKYIYSYNWLFIAMSCISVLCYKVSGYILIISLYRRVVFLPALINFQYYDYFSQHSFDYFRQSFLRHFLTSPYAITVQKIIARVYYSFEATEESSANTGFLGSGYMQGGFVVIMLYAVIIGFLIAIISDLSKQSPRIAISLLALPMYSLFSSSDLPTSLLTGGIGLCILLLFIISKDPKFACNNSYNMLKRSI